MVLNAKELRTSAPVKKTLEKLVRNPIYIVCEDVLDTYNTGSIFRLADAVSAAGVILCGLTETPPNTRIKKASINTWQWIEWKYEKSALEFIKKIKKEIKGLKVVSIEQKKGSVSLFSFKTPFPVCLVVGNETWGISKEVLALSDSVVEIPMFGINKSLNVMVSLGIVLYKCMELLEKRQVII